MWDHFAFPVWSEWPIEALISPELSEQLMHWSARGTEMFKLSPVGQMPATQEVHEWNLQGRRLAAALRAELGAAYVVEYFEEQ